MNNETNNFNNGQNLNTTPVVPATPVTSPVINNQINQTVVPTTTPVMPTAPVVPEVLTPQPVIPQQIVEPTTVPVTEVPTVPQVDNNTMVNENLQKVEINYKPPSKFKVFVLLLFFAGMVAFIIFLPQISSYVRNYGKNTGNYQAEEEDTITTGTLVCDLTSNTSELDKEYEFDFSFTDSKLTKTKYLVYTRGDSTTESLLDELYEKCKTLKEETKELEGVIVRCDYTDGKLNETQSFELETIDEEKLNAAFTEAGGIVPTYKYNQDIDDIEKNMKASGYSCERKK